MVRLDRLEGVRLTVDLDEPIREPTPGQLEQEVRRLVDPHTYGLTLERVGVAEPPSIDCVWSTVGWYLTRRGDVPTDVAQGRFGSEAAAVDALLEWAHGADGSLAAPEFHPLDPQPFPPIDADGHRWVRAPSIDERLTFLYEFNAVGIVVRAVELKGAEKRPFAAASLIEWRVCQRGLMQPETPATRRYGLRFGSVPEGCEADWGDYPRDAILAEEFERVWAHARKQLGEHPRGVS